MNETQQPKTILYVDHTAKIGGGEIAVANLIDVLDRRQFRPLVVLAEDGPLVAKLQSTGCEVHVLPLDKQLVDTRKDTLTANSASPLKRIAQLASIAAYSWKLAQFAKRRQASIIHTNSLKADIFGGIAARMAGKPVVWHIRDHVNGEYLPQRAASVFRWLARWLPGVTVVISLSVLRELTGSRNAEEQHNHSLAEDQAIPASANASANLLTRGARSAMSRYKLVYDGCKTEKRQLGHLPVVEDDNRPIIALIGRIAEWKGQDVFIDAAAEVLRSGHDAKFWIIGAPLFGEHEFERKLRHQVSELGIEDSVEFFGFSGDVAELLEQSDFVVHASILGEPFGQVVIEAMAAGKAVIATNGGAIPEIVVDGTTGLIVPMGDPRAMAEAIAELLTDPSRARLMGQAGRMRVLERFTVEQTARKIEAIYRALLNKAPSSEERAQV